MPGYGDEDFEQETVLTTLRTSRKQRKCVNCDAPISPGQRYARMFIPPVNGPAVTLAMHARPAECWWHDPADALAPIRHELPAMTVLNPELIIGGAW